ncbi:RBBP9/YdeN family alpha/beta hydrolase [Celerinatantimonas sp. MCCC 1A17872]|uniref:RBBP9/YdeN family alpha/beta hydrolase n=1 Tax=Celerinatantimonas sp. MCCC 1A17872 TaxID=3177514 RepID=UPI0038C1A7B0
MVPIHPLALIALVVRLYNFALAIYIKIKRKLNAMHTTLVIVPGLGNSTPQHWQTHLEQQYSDTIRVIQDDWDHPERAAWIARLQETIEQTSGKLILVGHSLGSIVISQWAKSYHNPRIKAGLLVAPADVDAPDALDCIANNGPIPTQPIGFKTIVVCSDNDPYARLERSQLFAKNWGSELICLKQAGHINADAGFGQWPLASELLERLERETQAVHS